MSRPNINLCCGKALLAVCDTLDDYLVTDMIPVPNPSIGTTCCSELDEDYQHRLRDFQRKWTIRKTKGNVLDWWDRDSLQHDIVIPGRGRRYPRCGDFVKVTFVTKLLDGTGVDWSRKPFKFVVGDPTVMKGLSQGVQLMRGGEKAKLYIPDFLGYGWWGLTNTPGMAKIPENADLIMTVNLLEIRR